MSRLLPVIFLVALVLTACRTDGPIASDAQPGSTPAAGTAAPSDATPATAEPTNTPEPTAAPTATPLPPKTLTVCMSAEPKDLYLYGDDSPVARAVRGALYEAPFTSLGYAYQPLALTKLPSPADGDAVVQEVEVSDGDLVYNASGEVVVLERGVVVRNQAGERITYNRDPIQLPQMAVDFTFRQLVWADGEPVTADDSVFSFEVASDRRTPQVDNRVLTTAAYEATGDDSVRWTGVPGYLPDDYMTNVWTPLPRHQLGDIAVDALPVTDEAAVTPLGYGAFQVAEWDKGHTIRLSRNPVYDRASEGLSTVDEVVFRFIDTVTHSLPAYTEGCDIITQDALSVDALPVLEESEAAGGLKPYVSAAPVMEYLIFGIDPVSFYGDRRPDWFEDARVRQGIAQCIDRQALVNELTHGRAVVENAYAPSGHPLLPDDLTTWTYDPAAGNALLDEAGFADSNGDGVRDDIASGQPFTVTIGTNAESALRMQLVEKVATDLTACGIQATPVGVPAGAWFAPGPQGVVFGRQFDIAEFSWVTGVDPNCGLFLTENIPGPVEQNFSGWGTVNVSAWSNDAFDAACRQAGLLLPGQEGYDEAQQEALRVFSQELPALPLFSRLRVAAAVPAVSNFKLDPTQPSELWNLYEIDIEETP